MPSRISGSRTIAYLRALAETGNATLAASHARVSRDWAYKRRKQDPQFDGLCREMAALAAQRLKAAATTPAQAIHSPPSPAADAAGPSLSRNGRGAESRELVLQLGLGKRVQVRRARARQWTGPRERRFLDALAATHDVELAATSAGMTAPSAYRHRAMWPELARRWDEALSSGGPHEAVEWIESAGCFLTGEPQPDNSPVRVTSVRQVLRLLERSSRMERRAG